MGLISPSATNATLTSSGFTTFHRIVPTDGVEGTQAADWLAKQVQEGLRRRRHQRPTARASPTWSARAARPRASRSTSQGVAAEHPGLRRDRPEGRRLRRRGACSTAATTPRPALFAKALHGSRLQGPRDDRQRWQVLGVHHRLRCCRQRLVLLLRLPGRHHRSGGQGLQHGLHRRSSTPRRRPTRRRPSTPPTRMIAGDQGGRAKPTATRPAGRRGRGQHPGLQGHHHRGQVRSPTARSPRRRSTCTSRRTARSSSWATSRTRSNRSDHSVRQQPPDEGRGHLGLAGARPSSVQLACIPSSCRKGYEA